MAGAEDSTGLAALLISMEHNIDERLAGIESRIDASIGAVTEEVRVIGDGLNSVESRVSCVECSFTRFNQLSPLLSDLEKAVAREASFNAQEVEELRDAISAMQSKQIFEEGAEEARRRVREKAIALFNWFLNKGWVVPVAIGAVFVAVAESANLIGERPGQVENAP